MVVAIAFLIFSCAPKGTNYETKSNTDVNGYSYETVENDPTGLRLYTLENGLKVYLSQNSDEPTIQTYIPDFKIKSRFDKPGAITPRNILSHHSGLLTDLEYMWVSENPPPFTTVVDLLNEEYTCTQPNTVFSYSGCNRRLRYPGRGG